MRCSYCSILVERLEFAVLHHDRRSLSDSSLYIRSLEILQLVEMVVPNRFCCFVSEALCEVAIFHIVLSIECVVIHAANRTNVK